MSEFINFIRSVLYFVCNYLQSFDKTGKFGAIRKQVRLFREILPYWELLLPSDSSKRLSVLLLMKTLLILQCLPINLKCDMPKKIIIIAYNNLGRRSSILLFFYLNIVRIKIKVCVFL